MPQMPFISICLSELAGTLCLVQLTWSICLERMECDKDEGCLWRMLGRKERESLTIQTHCVWLY